MTKPSFAKKARLATATAFVALMAAGSASALSLTFDGAIKGFKQVDMTGPTLSNINTGGFKMKDTMSNESFAVFCLDLLANIYNGKTYGYKKTDTPFANGAVDLTVVDGNSGLSGIDRVQRIFDSGYDTALDSKVSSAGFQMALWNAVYDVDWSVGDDATGANGGSFYQSDSNNEDVRAAANGFLSAAFAFVGEQNYRLSFLESTEVNPRSQNLVTAVPAMPLPAASLMLLTAFGGMFVARRRKKA